MTLRNIVLILGLATLLGGCVVTPRQFADYPDNNYYYDNDYYDYYDTPSYEGYYYVRIIFIGNAPYYVDDDRHIRPLPPRVYDHFRRSPYRTSGGRLPVFSRDAEVRDGYPMSRIVYLNNIPYYVGNDRSAKALPNNLHERFRYAPVPMNGGRPQPPQMRDDNRRYETPAFDRDRERNQPPAYGQDRDRFDDRGRPAPQPFERDRERNQSPAFGQDRDRFEQPANGRDRSAPQTFERDREPRNGGNDSVPFGSRMTPPRQEQAVPQPDQRNSNDPRGNAPFDGGRRNIDRPQPNGGKDRPGPEKKKPRGKDNGDGNGRDNGNRRD